MEPNKHIHSNKEPKPDVQESDSQRIIHRHLENKDDIITDEDIRNIRVGANPAEMDEPTRELINEQEAFRGDQDSDHVPSHLPE